jgi:cell pole-organizing protein PopZ
MAYYDSKHNDNMEAGLLSTHEEEERMLLKEALYQDEDPEPYMEPAPKNSPAKRILMALGICFLVGIAVVSIGSATGVCPGHMRHASPTEVSVKDAVHRHNPNLSHAMGYMAKRQNTPISSEASASQTQQATEPASTNEQTTQAQETTSEAAATTRAAASTTAEPETQATTAEPQSTEESDSSTDSGDQSTTEATQATITEGTKTTSSAVAKTLTSTRSDGGVVTFTSTSWVAVVPSSKATTTSNPDLQNAAPQFSGHSALTAAIGMIFGGLLLL